MAYADLLKDPRWQRKRLEVFEASGWRCQRCDNDKMELHVHHFHYLNGVMPWDYKTCDLACVCGDCHKELTAQRAALKLALAKYESHFLPIEKLIKYIEAQVAWIDGETVAVSSDTEARGVADAMGCDPKAVFNACVVGEVDPLELDAITSASPRIPEPANEAA